jgi:hypothetical protein
MALPIQNSAMREETLLSPSLDRVPTALKARSTRLIKCCLLLLDGGLLLLGGSLLLLLRLLSSGPVLPAALPARGDRARRGSSSWVVGHDFAHNCTTCRATRARTRGCPGRGCRRLGRRRRCRRWGWRLCRVEARLLHSPRVAGCLITLLLLRRLTLGRIHELLRAGV